MIKELASIAGVASASAAALAFCFAVLGYMGFRLVADTKKNETVDRASRSVIAKWSGLLIAGGLILGLLQFIFQVVMDYVSN